MIDAAQFTSWLFVALLFVCGGVLLTSRRSQALADRWEQLAARMAEHAEADDDEDAFARAELREVLREERLRADLNRLRHLVATDTYMSATRQLANRIAYQQVLGECRTFAQRPVLVAPDRSWALESADLSATRQITGPESLDIRWR